MKDSDLRTIILQTYYDLRKTSQYFKLDQQELGDIEYSEYERIGAQLGDKGYLDWSNSIDGGLGQGRITSEGIDVIEGTRQPAMAFNLNDHSIRVHGSTNVQIGNANTIKTSADVTKIEQAIDRMSLAEHEKTEAKSLLSRLSNNAAFASIVGAIVTLAGGQAH